MNIKDPVMFTNVYANISL